MSVETIEDTKSLLPLLNNSSFKVGISMIEDNLFDCVNWTEGKIFDQLVPERLFVEMFSMGFPRNHQFFEVFNEKLDQMQSGGLIDYYTSRYKGQLNPKRYSHLNNNSALKVNRFESGFVICLASTSFALFGFALEWFLKLKKYLVMRFMMSAFRDRVLENFERNTTKRIAKRASRLTSVEEETVERSELEQTSQDLQEDSFSSVDDYEKKLI